MKLCWKDIVFVLACCIRGKDKKDPITESIQFSITIFKTLCSALIRNYIIRQLQNAFTIHPVFEILLITELFLLYISVWCVTFLTEYKLYLCINH